jgi:hypothetical protein
VIAYLNVAVATANEGPANHIIHEINGTNELASLIEGTLSRVRRIQDTRSEIINAQTGERKTINQIPYITPAEVESLKLALKICKDKKFDLETQLSEVNATTLVSSVVKYDNNEVDFSAALDEAMSW